MVIIFQDNTKVATVLTNGKFFFSSESLSVDPRCLLTREDLPVLYQLLPDDLPHDLPADAEQLGHGGVGVVEAVQQDLRHLSLLLPENLGSEVCF